MAELGPETERAIREMVFAFFAEECGVDRSTLADGTNIISELEGDSLMFLMLLERVRKQALYRQGGWHDEHIMALLRDEWLALHGR